MPAMTYKEYDEMIAERRQEARRLTVAALENQIPNGYVLSDEPDQMPSNAYLRIKPEDKNHAGLFSIHFIYRDYYKLTKNKDSSLIITPTKESVFALNDVYNGAFWQKNHEWGEDGKVEIPVPFYSDLALSVRDMVSMVMTQEPFVSLKWVRDEHDPLKHYLLNGDKKLGCVWKASHNSGTYYSLSGESCKTLAEIKSRTESSARFMLKSENDEKLAWMTDSQPNDRENPLALAMGRKAGI